MDLRKLDSCLKESHPWLDYVIVWLVGGALVVVSTYGFLLAISFDKLISPKEFKSSSVSLF